MEYFSDRMGLVSGFFQELWQCCKVTRKVTPVIVKVIQMEGIWSSAGQQGVSTGGTQGLLERNREGF